MDIVSMKRMRIKDGKKKFVSGLFSSRNIRRKEIKH